MTATPDMSGDPRLDEAVQAALSRIYDPCSVAAGRPKTLLEMGLVLGWRLCGPGALRIDFCVTFPLCTMAPHFTEAARDELVKIGGIDSVDLRIDHSFLWSSDRMSADDRGAVFG